MIAIDTSKQRRSVSWLLWESLLRSPVSCGVDTVWHGGRKEASAALYLADTDRWLVFSSGFGSRIGDYHGLACALRRRGWSVAVLVHPGSDRAAALRLLPARLALSGERLRLLAHSEENLRCRPLQFLRFTRALQRRFKPRCLVSGGHSFGAFTAMAASGVPILFQDGQRLRLAERVSSFTGLVVISPQKVGHLCHPQDYGCVAVPGLYITGTRDRTPDGTDFRARLAAIERVPESLREVAVFEPAGHMDFAGLGRLDLAEDLASEVYRFLSGLG